MLTYRKMKMASTCLIVLSLILELFFDLSCGASGSITHTFLHCLSSHSDPSHPISEAIYTPTNSSFSSILKAYVRNPRFISPKTPKPLVIVAAKHESHVQATVICSKAKGLLLRTRSGGHDFEALSYTSKLPFVVLDMFNLRSINIDLADNSMWVQAGATMGEIYYNIAQKSNTHAFPAGVCPTLGTGGHISGGGYGNLLRKYGLSVDHVLDAQLVDVNGKILNRKAMDKDVFWAIRGGGGASFGVVLSWKLNLVPIPEIVTVFRVNRTLEQGATDLVYKWEKVSSKLPNDLFIRLELKVINGNHADKKTIVATFVAMFTGKAENLLQILEENFPELELQKKECIEMSWIESALYWVGFPRETPTNVLLNRVFIWKIFIKSKSDFVKQPISKEGLEAIFKKMMLVEDVMMQWNPYGGRMSELPETATPPPHRAGYLFKIHYMIYWVKNSKQISDRHLRLAKELYDFMAPYVTNSPREAFLNYRDLDIGGNPNCSATFQEAKVIGSKYFKGNFDRLVKAKTIIDPDNFFRNEQSIPPLPPSI